jgi:prepilin-type N-terminal cleavage/methylation domain-containing protein
MISRPKGAEAGFTLVELLIVMVILPLIVAAIAVAIISTERNAGTTSARLSDSANAQISSEYYIPDIQSAQFVTTIDVPPPPSPGYSSTIPQVCGDGTGTSLLLGLYRPAIGSTGTMSVGYWVTTAGGSSSIMRYSCTLNSSFNASVVNKVVISDDISTPQGTATVTPAQFNQAAGAGWTPVTAGTTASIATYFPPSGTFSLPVTSTSAFDLSQPIAVTTSGGFVSVNCTGYQPLTGSLISGPVVAGPGTSFTGCSSAVRNTTAALGYAVTQPASMSGVNLSVYQPGSAYTYRLAAVPRAYGTMGGNGNGGGPGVGAPALLTLGGADSVQGGANAILTVNGNVNINGGSLTCTGGPYLHAYGYGAISGTSAFNPPSCATGGPTSTQAAIPDPYANVAPAYGSANFPYETQITTVPGNGACVPGEYTVVFTCKTLQPGIYVLDKGLSSPSITMASGTPPNQGVLLYLPCDPPGAPTTCNESVSMGGNSSVNVPGLSVSQVAKQPRTDGTGGFRNTALQGLVLWQDKGDATGATLGGTSNSVTLLGTVYLPNAGVTIQGGGNGTNITTGRVIAKSLTMAGSASATINPT